MADTRFDGHPDPIVNLRIQVDALKMMLQVLIAYVADLKVGDDRQKEIAAIKNYIQVVANNSRYSDPATADMWRREINKTVSQVIDPMLREQL